MGIKICPKCGKKVSDTRRDCPHCGFVVDEEKVVCPDCQEIVENGVPICPTCGRVLSEGNSAQDEEAAKGKGFSTSDPKGDIKRLSPEENKVTCPYCGSTGLNEIGGNFFQCEVCRNKFPNMESAVYDPIVQPPHQPSNSIVQEGRDLSTETIPALAEDEHEKNAKCESAINPKASRRKKRLGISLAAAALIGIPAAIVVPLVVIPNVQINKIKSGDFFDFSKVNNAYEISLNKNLYRDYASYFPSKISIPREHNGLPIATVGNWAFQGCTSLAEITIPSSVASIGTSAFNGCSSLTEITIPDSVTSIGEWAFQGCTSLAEITIPSSVDSIANGAFMGCDALINTFVSISSVPDFLAIEWKSTLRGNVHLIDKNGKRIENMEIPSSVTTLKGGAFSNCSSLKKIAVPNTITEIGQYAFSGCTSLTEVSAPIGPGWKWLPESVRELTIFPGKGSAIGSRDFLHRTNLTRVTIENGVTSIGDWAFQDCTSLAEITIPSSVTSIGSSAFSGCSSLKKIAVPNTITEIGQYAFSGCSSLKSVTIPDSVTSIRYCAFQNCSSLESIVIPNSVTSIGEQAFWGCASLTKLFYVGTSLEWSSVLAQSGNQSLSNATIYFYSESQTGETGNFWHYVNGLPSVW